MPKQQNKKKINVNLIYLDHITCAQCEPLVVKNKINVIDTVS